MDVDKLAGAERVKCGRFAGSEYAPRQPQNHALSAYNLRMVRFFTRCSILILKLDFAMIPHQIVQKGIKLLVII